MTYSALWPTFYFLGVSVIPGVEIALYERQKVWTSELEPH